MKNYIYNNQNYITLSDFVNISGIPKSVLYNARNYKRVNYETYKPGELPQKLADAKKSNRHISIIKVEEAKNFVNKYYPQKLHELKQYILNFDKINVDNNSSKQPEKEEDPQFSRIKKLINLGLVPSKYKFSDKFKIGSKINIMDKKFNKSETLTILNNFGEELEVFSLDESEGIKGKDRIVIKKIDANYILDDYDINIKE